MHADKQHRLTAAALKKLPKAAVAELQLDGDRLAAVLAGLAQEGFVSEKTVRKSVSWHLTETGTAYLATLPAWPALSLSNGPPPPIVKPVHDNTRLLARSRHMRCSSCSSPREASFPRPNFGPSSWPPRPSRSASMRRRCNG